MASRSSQLHFVLFPFMAQGHMSPMIDTARLLAQHGTAVTVVTTPFNAKRFAATFTRALEAGLQMQFVELQFPCEEEGLPNGCENLDLLPSLGLANKFFTAVNKLLEEVLTLFKDLKPRPSCIISDSCLPYTIHVANRFGIPRISFTGFSCFCLLCIHNMHTSKNLESLSTESEYVIVPGMPHRLKFSKGQLPVSAVVHNTDEFHGQVIDAEMMSYGSIVNSFEELESAYAQGYKKAKGGRVWCVGPVSLCNKNNLDMLQRGDNASVDECQCLTWLDSQQPASVIYVCLGSLCSLITSQLIELGLLLEASNRPFIWVIRGGGKSKELEKWLAEEGFEERIGGRGLIMRGWAPQVAILSHIAIGGFLTHCGWNSVLEWICYGTPLVTWPVYGDQFCNEKLVVQVLRVGIRIEAELTNIRWGEEEKVGVLARKEDISKALERLMNEGVESEERRKRIRELCKMAKEALEEGGSSFHNIRFLIENIVSNQLYAMAEQ